MTEAPRCERATGLFGLQRALKTIEDFTEFEQDTADFDGDIVIATNKGVPLVRESQVDFMADFEETLDFPSASKLEVFCKLIRQDDATIISLAQIFGLCGPNRSRPHRHCLWNRLPKCGRG